MTALQLIIKKAQALRKASPKKFAKWTDYVKAASATIKPKKKATVGAIKKKSSTKKSAAKKVVKKAPVKKVIKKAATKKATSIHKDTKSHNVRISVMSGMDIAQTTRELQNWQKIVDELRKELKTAKPEYKATIKKDIELSKKFLVSKKQQLSKQIRKIK
jgi:hypothetical protein